MAVRASHPLTLLVLAAAIVLSACRDASAPSAPAEVASPHQALHGQPPRWIPGQYIVVFRDDGVDPHSRARALVGKHRAQLRRTYTAALKGMAVELPDSAVAALRKDPAVAYVEQNQEVSLAGEPVIQLGAPLGLDRIDQRTLPLNGAYSYASDGAGVRVYLLDSGINFGHAEFGGRAVLGFDALGTAGGGVDCNGHGTHVAGTVGGSTYGVAKKVQLVAVRVLDCEGRGNIFFILDGIDWVTRNRVRPAVANMSVGTGLSATINQAVTNSIASGVTFVVAAGNTGSDACTTSPSSVSGAITVAATDQADVFASFSNYGSCVDLAAPGVGITSAWVGSTNATMVLSGTSMATPHVAGTAALYLSSVPYGEPILVAGALSGNATQNTVTSLPAGTPNRLLYTSFLVEDPTLNPWTGRAQLQAARSAFALGLAASRLHAIGGRSNGAILASVEAYDPATNAWRRRASLPAARYDGNGTWNINGVLYLAGGRNASGTLTKTLYAYNVSTNTWTSKAPMPVASGCGGTVVAAGHLFVFTGCTSSGFTGLLHRYSPTTNSWTTRAAAPEAHGHPAIGVINGKIYVAGGRNAAGVPTSSLHVYDPLTNSWSSKRSMPAATFGAGSVAVNGKLHVVGGALTVGPGALTSLLVYHPPSDAWSSRAFMPSARSRLGAQAVNGFLYAVGGRNGSTDLTVVERYTP